MLLGTYQAKFALGHRVAVPAQLRKDLGETYVLAKWYEGCLVLVGKGSWDALLTRLTGGVEAIIAPVRDTEHFIFASAYELTPDEQGRIVVPERLAHYANLKTDIYFLGIRDRVEFWDKEIWDEREKLVTKEAAAYIEELDRRNEKK